MDTEHIEEKCYVRAINSDLLQSEDRVVCDDEEDIPSEEPKLGPKYNLIEEQKKDSKLSSIMQNLEQKGDKSKFKNRYIIMGDILYYVDTGEGITTSTYNGYTSVYSPTSW